MTTDRLWIIGLLLIAGIVATAKADTAVDRSHSAWTTQLAAHVRWNADGSASTVDYAGFARDRAQLDRYRTALAAVPEAEFAQWPGTDRLAFLINAYNANTIALILTRYPKLESIKDLGSLFSSPWKQRFVELLGATRSLDEIEHELIRGAPDFAEPRVHFALNCASIGCPALRPEAYRGEQLEAQLADQTRRFLSDRSRNRYVAKSQSLQVSRIFDWYGRDFGHAAGSVAKFLGRYAQTLGDDEAARARIATGAAAVEFLDYNWQLNDAVRVGD